MLESAAIADSSLATLWYVLLAGTLTCYVILDGFDLGVGSLLHRVARSAPERDAVLRSIAPYWDGNEVWLITSGGTLFMAFPKLFASSFSGFYLPLMMVLWLLILRAIALEFRHQLHDPLWIALWERVFSGASLLLAFVFGTALGNVVRGAPLSEEGTFFLPLWTDFRLSPEPGILDWYTLSVGALASVSLAQHGALFLALKTEESLRASARRWAQALFWAVLAGTALVTIASFAVQPQIRSNCASRSWGLVFPLLAVASLWALIRWRNQDRDLAAFLASCGFLAGMLASAAWSLYPLALPATTGKERALTVAEVASPSESLRVGLYWWPAGMVLVAFYFVFLYRRFRGRITLEQG
jgi:cytochrome d ubiquinol oxidase subunit II